MDLEKNKILILTSNHVVHSYYGLFFLIQSKWILVISANG